MTLRRAFLLLMRPDLRTRRQHALITAATVAACLVGGAAGYVVVRLWLGSDLYMTFTNH